MERKEKKAEEEKNERKEKKKKKNRRTFQKEFVKWEKKKKKGKKLTKSLTPYRSFTMFREETYPMIREAEKKEWKRWKGGGERKCFYWEIKLYPEGGRSIAYFFFFFRLCHVRAFGRILTPHVWEKEEGLRHCPRFWISIKHRSDLFKYTYILVVDTPSPTTFFFFLSFFLPSPSKTNHYNGIQSSRSKSCWKWAKDFECRKDPLWELQGRLTALPPSNPSQNGRGSPCLNCWPFFFSPLPECNHHNV